VFASKTLSADFRKNCLITDVLNPGKLSNLVG